MFVNALHNDALQLNSELKIIKKKTKVLPKFLINNHSVTKGILFYLAGCNSKLYVRAKLE